MTRCIFLDIESTGLCEPEHRIVEFFGAHYDLESKRLEAELLHRIDPQRGIAVDAQRVHGISSAELIGKPTFEMVGGEIRDFLLQGDLVVAHNGDTFDLPFLNMEFQRVGLPAIKWRSFDTMSCRWATPAGKPPSLQEFAFACGIDYDPAQAHAAAYDVKVMGEAFFNGLEWGWINLEETV